MGSPLPRQKNRLTAADAQRVGGGFPEPGWRNPGLCGRPRMAGEAAAGPATLIDDAERLTSQSSSAIIDKTELTLPEPRRIRDRDHVKSVAKHSCLICGRRPADAHHLRFAQSRALGRKVSDEFTVPLWQRTPSRDPPLWRRSGMVEAGRDRSYCHGSRVMARKSSFAHGSANEIANVVEFSATNPNWYSAMIVGHYVCGRSNSG